MLSIEHSYAYKQLNDGLSKLREGMLSSRHPKMATRLSTMLVNHRSMLEVSLLEQQVQEVQALLASYRAEPIRLLNGTPTPVN